MVGFVKQVDSETGMVCEVHPVYAKEKNILVSGDEVLCRILSVNPRFAKLNILCKGSKALSSTFSGVIRRLDIRRVEVDKVKIYESFRPGDIVRAQIISLGDSRSYYLSTAKPQLGVINATSQSGGQLQPVSYQEMKCSITGQKERRKVAKVRQT
eukprot:g2958.t1